MASKGEQQEQRRHRRLTPLPTERVEVQLGGGDFLEVLEARDISQSGVGIYVPHNFTGIDIDREIELLIKLPKRSSFRARGRVRHKNLPGTAKESGNGFFGIEFTQISKEARAAITDYLIDLDLYL